MKFWLSNRLLKERTALTCPPWRLLHLLTPSCQSNSFPRGYVEDCLGLSAPLEGCFISPQVVIC